MVRELDVVLGVWTHYIIGGVLCIIGSVLEETFHQLETVKITS